MLEEVIGAMLKKALKHYPEVKGIHEACSAVPGMSEDEFDDLVHDMREHGLAENLTLDSDSLLLDGRHRLMACYATDTEPRFRTTTVDPWVFNASANVIRRHLAVGQKAVFADAMRIHFDRKAKERQKGGQGGKLLPVNLPEAKGDARDAAGKAVGISGSSVDKAKTVRIHRPDLMGGLKTGELSLDHAYKEARKTEKSKASRPMGKTDKSSETEMVSIVTVEGKVGHIPKPKATKFNQTNDSVDWARWTWNPVTGCRHGCPYCYAREIAYSDRMESLYPFKFEPSFHEYRLEAPKNMPVPDGNDPRDGRVFVCSMADLFGKWVPLTWVQMVFDACLGSPEWEYLFLTKWPVRYAKLPLLKKAWYGATIVKQQDVSRVEKAMGSLDVGNGVVRWVSLEPMLTPIQFSDLLWCDLMVIGGQTSTSQPDGYVKEFAPEFDWIVDVVNQCRKFGVPYYLKANVGLERPGMRLPKMEPRRR